MNKPTQNRQPTSDTGYSALRMVGQQHRAASGVKEPAPAPPSALSIVGRWHAEDRKAALAKNARA
jgi:hypothetical protein